MESEKKQKLRIGLLMETYNLPLWEYTLVKRLIESHYASIELLIFKNSIVGKNRSLFARISDINNWKKAAFRVYRDLDLLLYKPDQYAFDRKEATELLKQVPTIVTKTISTNYSDRFCMKDIQKIGEYDLDILIRLGFKILRGDILKIARYGVWSYHHGDNRINRGGYAGFWEIVEGKLVAGANLQILNEDLDNGLVLYRSLSHTIGTYSQNINKIYWKSVSFLPRKLEELYNIGGKLFFNNVNRINEHPCYYSEKLYLPRNAGYRLISKLIINQLIKRIKSKLYFMFYFNQWILQFHIKKGYSDSFWRYKKIIPPKDRFWADPFVIFKDEKYYIFIEEYIYRLRKGHISCIIMDSKGNYQFPIKVLDKSFHLSYPHIFKSESDLFMIPETGSEKVIDLYKCTKFPNKWEFVTRLMENVEAYDSTLFFHDNKYWLFTNIRENKGASENDELFLFYSDTLLTNDWKSHPNNPIVSDVTRARPAGNIFIRDSKIYRPSQNCSKTYGYGIKINHIVTISENYYEEKEIGSILPNWDNKIISTHTYNASGSLNIIDVRMRRRKLF